MSGFLDEQSELASGELRVAKVGRKEGRKAPGARPTMTS